MATGITYDGNVIASIEEGQTATLKCAAKKAKSDIVVTFGSAGHITYNGAEISVPAGKTANLACSGKKMKTDVIVSAAPAANGVRLLTSDGYVLTDLNGIIITIKE